MSSRDRAHRLPILVAVSRTWRPAADRAVKPFFHVAEHSAVIRLLGCPEFVDPAENFVDPTSNEFGV
jgi:hypothetical protein